MVLMLVGELLFEVELLAKTGFGRFHEVSDSLRTGRNGSDMGSFPPVGLFPSTAKGLLWA